MVLLGPTVLAVALTAALMPATAALAQQPATQPSNSPSAPPFWARPRPATPDCACPTEPAVPLQQPAARTPALLGGVLSGAALLLGVVLWWRRRRTEDAATQARTPVLVPATAPNGPRPVQAPVSDGLDPRARRRAEAAAKTEAAAAPPPPDELELADPRSAKIELAESEPGSGSAAAQAFYAEIAASLAAALRKEPARQDLRRKLLEIYYSARQVTEFVNLAHEYLDRNQGVRDQFWADIGAMGAALAPEHELFREWTAEGRRTRPAPARSVQLRRYHERNVDQGRMYTAQQALIADFQRLRAEESFQGALRQLLADSVRRPAPLTASPELAYVADGAQIYVKHEDRRRFHDDVMMNAVGQILTAQRLGRTRVVTATRDGIHGHAVAGAAARLGIDCTIYIAERDLNRYYARVLSMRRLGAHIRPIPSGGEDPVDPRRAAMEAWLDEPDKVQFVSGLTAGPPPYPDMVREFLAVVGRETVEQMQQTAGGLPAAVVAGVCDGHLGLGLLQGLLDQPSIQLYCVEEKPGRPAQATADTSLPEPRTPALLTRREHHWLRESKRVTYVGGEDHETLRIIEQFHATGATLLTESARTMAYARALARRRERRESVVVLMTNQEGADFRAQRYDW